MSLRDREYDVVVVGGGIFGICIAWDAALRGLSVALLEKGDFAQAASANCFKMVHGGVRYLQHGDVRRIRESSRERTILLRIAPHLVDPLPIVVPTYGHGLQSKEVLNAGLYLYDLLTLDRNRGIGDSDKRIRHGRTLSSRECLELFPGLDAEGLTGGVLFYDGHMYNPARLALAFLKSAIEAGAQAANHTAVTKLLRRGDRVVGVQAKDELTGDVFDVRARMVVNAAGPWASHLLNECGLPLNAQPVFSRDTAFVVKGRKSREYALAVQGATKDPDAILNRGNRHLFMVPWRDYTLVGVWHVVYSRQPDEATVTEEEVQGFLDEFNASYRLPSPLTLQDVSLVNAGLVLFGQNQAGATDLSYGKRSLIIDHQREYGTEGLVSVVGVRYTTARGVAEKVMDLVSGRLGQTARPSQTAVTPVHGGDLNAPFQEFLGSALDRRPAGVRRESMYSLVRNHGAHYRDVLAYLNEDPSLAQCVGETVTLRAEVAHAARKEMARKLSDVVFRRTEMGTGEYPGERAIRESAEVMARELGWSPDRARREAAEVKAAFPSFVVRAAEAKTVAATLDRS
jgi:glycerol-3-phosphate dehydrogenase